MLLYKSGAIVDRFIGLRSESVIREMLERHVERESDRARTRAALLARNGNIDEAIKVLKLALEKEQDNDRIAAALADLLIDNHDVDAAQALLDSMTPARHQDSQMMALNARIGFARTAERAPPVGELLDTLEKDEGNDQARYLLGIRHAAVGEYEFALEDLLKVIEHNRRFGDDTARKDIIAIFDLLGSSHALVGKHRSKMARVMF